jgi:hypothetical protein
VPDLYDAAWLQPVATGRKSLSEKVSKPVIEESAFDICFVERS